MPPRQAGASTDYENDDKSNVQKDELEDDSTGSESEDPNVFKIRNPVEPYKSTLTKISTDMLFRKRHFPDCCLDEFTSAMNRHAS